MSNIVEIQVQGTFDFGDVTSGLKEVEQSAHAAGDGLNSVNEPAEHVKKNLHETGASGHEAKEALSGLNGVLGQVSPGLGELARSTQEVIGSSSGEMGLLGLAGVALIAVGAIVKLGMEGGNLATELMRMSAVTGLSIERTDYWGKAFSDVGGSMNTLTMASRLTSAQIEKLNSAVESGSELTAKEAKMYDLLGGQLHDTNGELLTGGQLIEQMIPKLAAMDNEGERNRVGMALFSRSWRDIAPLVANYDQVSEKAEKQSKRLADAMGTDVASAAIKYNEKMTDIKTSMEILEMKALPPVIDLLGGLANALEKIINMGDVVIKFTVTGLDKIDNVLEKLTGGSGLAHAFGNGLLNAVPGYGAAKLLMSGDDDDTHGHEKPGGSGGSTTKADRVSASENYNAVIKKEGELKKINTELEKAKQKVEEENRKIAVEALAQITKGEMNLAQARKAGLTSMNGPGRVEDAKIVGALEGHAAILKAIDDENSAAFEYVATLSRVAEMYKESAKQGLIYVEGLERETKAKIDAAMSEVFGKGTQEQARMALNIDKLELALSRAPHMGGGGFTVETPQGKKAVESLQQAADVLKRLGVDIHNVPKGYDVIAGKGGAEAERLKRQLDDAQRHLRESQLTSKIREDTVGANDKSRPTDAEQAKMAKELASWTANTTGEMRKLAQMSGTDLFKSFGAARDANKLSSDAARVLADDAFSKNLIPKSYEVAGAYDAIVAAASEKNGAADALNKLTAAALAAQAELDKLKTQPGGAGPQSIKPPNVGDAGIVPHPRSLGGAMGRHGM